MNEMSQLGILSTVIYLALIFVSSIISVLGSIGIISFLTRKSIDVKEEIVKNKNVGIALVLVSFIWAIGRMCIETVRPIMNAWYSGYASGFTFKTILFFSLGFLGSLLVALISGALIIFLSMRILMVVTRDIDEWLEIKHGNTAVALVIAATIFVVGMFFESIISYIVIHMFGFLI